MKMVQQKILLENKQYEIPYSIDQSKVVAAAEKALNKIEKNIDNYKNGFVESGLKYRFSSINQYWTHGMQTGCLWLAYEISGNKIFKDVAEHHFASYRTRFDEKIGMDDHDVGFVFSPSCVAQYKITGDEKARKCALDAAKYLYEKSYSKEGKFIIRSHVTWHTGGGCRTMMDSLMNAPLLFWASSETGNMDYHQAGVDHNKTTIDYLIREDASTFHHYQFEPQTAKPVRGLTWQGYSDDSCWSRGHSWGISGFPITYAYTHDDSLLPVHKDITYYMLNHLPDDHIPYWDYTFGQGSTQPRDSSAGVIAVCGMREMCKHLPDTAEQKAIFENASARILESTIANCAGDDYDEYDGLICHVTGALPQNAGIDACALYADYFYLEALMRYIRPDWKMYW